MQSVLVTGINGFVGHHVASLLASRDIPVLGVGMQPSLNPALESASTNYISCDLTNPEQVAKINLSNIRAIINLAGIATVGDSAGKGDLYNHVNVSVHSVLYEECLRQSAAPRIIAISTGAVYDSAQPMPLTEESTLIRDELTNEYVISKKRAEGAIRSFNERGLHCIIVRPFNHTGPGQMPGFLLPDLYEQVVSSIKNQQPIVVGNLNTRRDFTDVRDVAKAYVDLALCNREAITSSVYNVCSGRSLLGKEILMAIAAECGLQNPLTSVDPKRLRKNEIMDIYGSPERLHAAIGWAPSIPIQTTIRDFVSDKRR